MLLHAIEQLLKSFRPQRLAQEVRPFAELDVRAPPAHIQKPIGHAVHEAYLLPRKPLDRATQFDTRVGVLPAKELVEALQRDRRRLPSHASRVIHVVCMHHADDGDVPVKRSDPSPSRVIPREVLWFLQDDACRRPRHQRLNILGGNDGPQRRRVLS